MPSSALDKKDPTWTELPVRYLRFRFFPFSFAQKTLEKICLTCLCGEELEGHFLALPQCSFSFFSNHLYDFLMCSYLLILDRTNWKTNILTGLLIPYIFFSLPSLLFNIFRWMAWSNPNTVHFYRDWSHLHSTIVVNRILATCRGQVGKWIAFIAVILRLFFPRRFPGTVTFSEFPGFLFLSRDGTSVESAYSQKTGRLLCVLTLRWGIFIFFLFSNWEKNGKHWNRWDMIRTSPNPISHRN